MRIDAPNLKKLLENVGKGELQLPDFQRKWVWDDNRIKALIMSIIRSYPVGAAMFLEYGNENIHMKYKPIQGTDFPKDSVPSSLILDGQQRLTSLYNALFSKAPVHTITDKGKEIDRFYYLNIEKALDPNADDDDIVLSIPDNRILSTEFGRKVIWDVTTREKEFKQKLYPLNLIMDYQAQQDWQNDYYQFYDYNRDIIKQFTQFNKEFVMPTMDYKMPVIILDKDTPKIAVCQVFENVNTGGVPLTVFELVTAIFAMDDFDLREHWDNLHKNIFTGDILHKSVNATDFLTACTLLSSYKAGSTVSCKKKDVLNLKLTDYQNYEIKLAEGFKEAEKFLHDNCIFSSKDLPYSTQLIPLAVLFTILNEGNRSNSTIVRDKISQWLWCGILGELYGGANETRYVQDVTGVMKWLDDDSAVPKTVAEAYFNPPRLLTLQSRQSAAYKGIMALVYKNHGKDFMSGRVMDLVLYEDSYVDIHHVFPKKYCQENGYPWQKWNSVVNKTPITYKTNREIGGVAPSIYLAKIEKDGKVEANVLNTYLESHMLDVESMRTDNFDLFIIRRAEMLLDAIEKAMGKPVGGRDTDEVRNKFGGAL